MKRDLYQELVFWKRRTDFMPLLLRGARQVGKTFLVRELAEKEFDSLVEVNFELQPDLKNCFRNLEPKAIISALELSFKTEIQPGKTLLFLDEIQECPNAIMALRYFKEKMPNLHVIGAGSLLEFVLNDENFRMPVGRIEFLHLRPLSFLEFLDALGHHKLRQAIESVTRENPPLEVVHTTALKLMREYMFVGGMPSAVVAYRDHDSPKRCQDIQSAILNAYRGDFGKYSRHTQYRYLQLAYERIPGLISDWFSYSNLDPAADYRQLKVALHKLSDAGLIHFVYHTAAAGLPLMSHANLSKFKLLFLDVGLVQRALGLEIELMRAEDLLLVNRGALAEQLVGQELAAYANPRQETKLFTWAREEKSSSAEVDFVTTVGAQIVPIEVKAGSTGRLKSLNIFLDEKNLSLGIKVSGKPFGLDKRVLSVPFYLLSRLSKLIPQSYL